MPPSTSSLPARPNLEHLRNQAKDLLKAYRSGEPSAISRFRESLPRYSLLTDDDLRRLSLSLGDAQRVIATEYGFQNWLDMRHYVERKDGATLIEMTVDHVRVNSVTNQRTVVLKEKESDRYLPICDWAGGRGRHSDEAGGTGDAPSHDPSDHGHDDTGLGGRG